MKGLLSNMVYDRGELNGAITLVNEVSPVLVIIESGSKTLPFMGNPNDADVVIVAQERDGDSLKELLGSELHAKVLASVPKGVDVHIRTPSLERKWEMANPQYIHYLSWSCENGYDDGFLRSLREHEIWDDGFDLTPCVERWSNMLMHLSPSNDSDVIKRLYALRLLLDILGNRSYELTDEQIRVINLLHDRSKDAMEDRRAEFEKLLVEFEELKAKVTPPKEDLPPIQVEVVSETEPEPEEEVEPIIISGEEPAQ